MDSESIDLIRAMVSPVVMISGCGVLAIAASNRYGRLLERTHALHREAIDLQRAESDEHETRAYRLEGIEVLTHLMLSKARLNRFGLLCIVVCVGLTLCSMLALGAATLEPAFGGVGLGAFLLGVFALLVGMVAHVFEISRSLDEVQLEHARIERLLEGGSKSDDD